MLEYLKLFCRILKFSGRRYASDQLGQRAVVLTYYTLFAIVPLAALLFGVAKGFSLEEQLQETMYSRFSHHRELLEWIYQFANTTLRRASGSVVAGVGVIALLWTVVWLIAYIEKSFNAVWGLPPRRNLWRKFSDYISLLLLTPIMMVTISTLGVFLRSKLQALGDVLGGGFWAQTADVAANMAPLLVVCVLFALIYKFVPNTKVNFKCAFAAGILAGICYQVLQDGFLFLQKTVFTYNQIYGSFAALPLFLVWLNWSWQIVLFGAEISFVWQHIDSGIFDDKAINNLSLRLRREHQLAVLSMVFREFERGQGILAEQEIIRRLKLPDIVLRAEINELIELKMLCRSMTADGMPGLLPGVPPEKFTIMEFVRKINGEGDGETPEFAKYDKIFKNMEQQLSSSDLNINIHKL